MAGSCEHGNEPSDSIGNLAEESRVSASTEGLRSV
jgi:hypothetical protein